MKLITKELAVKLEAGRVAERAGKPAIPVMKLFNPAGAGTWLVSSIDSDGIMFGLADLGMGFPEMGDISLAELEDLELPFGLKIERDLHWQPKAGMTLSDYAAAARAAGRIEA